MHRAPGVFQVARDGAPLAPRVAMKTLSLLCTLLLSSSFVVIGCGGAEPEPDETSASADELGWCPVADRRAYDSCRWGGGGWQCDNLYPGCSSRDPLTKPPPSNPVCYGVRTEMRQKTTDDCIANHTLGSSAVPKGTDVLCRVGHCDGRDVELGCRFLRCNNGSGSGDR